jgi:carboxymethylenebutenolidase
MMFALPRAVDAQAVKEQDVVIKTPDGECDAYHASGRGASAAVIGIVSLGLRPAFRQMGKRLAESGYSVLVVNPFAGEEGADRAASRIRFRN